MRDARAERRGVFWIRSGRIPGVGRDDESGLLQGRDVSAVKREKALFARRLGRRTATQKSADGELRTLGVPVFDRNSGLSELHSYLTSRR